MGITDQPDQPVQGATSHAGDIHAQLATAEQPVKFVSNFAQIRDIKKLRDNLLAGKDVELELEFNGIVLDEADRATLRAFMPILAKIGAHVPAYPWLNFSEEFNHITLANNGKKISRNGHSIGLKAAKAMWDKASKYWAGLSKKPGQYTVGSNYYNSGYSVAITDTTIAIGCQTIPRAEVEYIARWQNWEPAA